MTFGHWAVWEFTPCTADFRCRRETVWLVRADGKDPPDTPLTTVLMKDHCEYTAGWQVVPEEMHTIYDCDC
jgi:hypothetical protein